MVIITWFEEPISLPEALFSYFSVGGYVFSKTVSLAIFNLAFIEVAPRINYSYETDWVPILKLALFNEWASPVKDPAAEALLFTGFFAESPTIIKLDVEPYINISSLTYLKIFSLKHWHFVLSDHLLEFHWSLSFP